jgi:DNA polymerase alpha-associated DNA helicase A
VLFRSALKWIDYTHGCESLEGTSLYNETELGIIVDLLTSRTELASECLSAASEKVMVITFYAAQARRLEDRLQATRPDVLVMTVDSAQGSETDYVILSCVRCNGGHDIGRFVADDRRVNVAMSRARKQLIVVGSSKTLVRRQQYGADLWSAFKKHTAAAGITTVWGDNAIKVASSASSICSMYSPTWPP